MLQPTHKKLTSLLLAPLLTLFVCIIIHFTLPSDGLLFLIIKFVVGIFALLYIPGFCLVTCFLKNTSFENIPFYILFGFLFQLLSTFMIFAIGLFLKPVDFIAFVYTFTTSFVVVLTVYSYKMDRYFLRLKNIKMPQYDRVLLLILLLFLVTSVYYQQFSTSPTSDGAAYLDIARNIRQEGLFSSNMLFPSSSYQGVEWTAGFHSYIFAILSIAIFFAIGNVSLLSAQILLMFVGFLLLILVYVLCKHLFGSGTARIAALLVAIAPIFLLQTSLVGGPEMVSLLFVFLFIYLTLMSFSYPTKLLLPILAGISLFVTWYAWRFNFLVLFLGVLPSLFLYFSIKNKQLNLKNFLLFGAFCLAFLLEYRFTLNWTLSVLGFSFPSIILGFALLVFLLKMHNDKQVLKIFISIILSAYCLLFMRYTFQIALMPLIEQAFANSNVYSANAAATLGFLGRLLNADLITKYSLSHWTGLSLMLSQVTIFLGLLSFTRISKFKETLIIFSFPAFYFIFWSLLASEDFQPRYIFSASIFWIILAASSLSFFIFHLSKGSMHLKQKMLKLNKLKLSIPLNSVVKLLAFLLIFLNLLLFWGPIYDKVTTVTEGWNFVSIYGWEKAIGWVNENTQPDDVIMARQGNYWAWYTNRKSVFLTPEIYTGLNSASLISTIKDLNVTYLVVDSRFNSEFPELQSLYNNQGSFYGSNVVFSSENEQGYRTIIYNVTNIAKGVFERKETLIDSCDSTENWSIFQLYGNGTVTADSVDLITGDASLAINCTVISQKDLINSTVVTFQPLHALNLNNSSFLSFWIKAPFNHSETLNVKLATDQGNYFMISVNGFNTQNWTQISIPLTNVVSVLGSPDINSITFLQFYIKDVIPGAYTYWLDDITVFNEKYVIEV